MFHHISIAVDNPIRVAQVLAEIWQGRFFPFPMHPDGYIVLAGDAYGTAIEVLPLGTELVPGSSERTFSQDNFFSPFTATHAAISVPIGQAEIERLAKREGWRALLCNRGHFQVIEFWIENKLLLELLPPAIVSQYLKFMQPDNFENLAV